MEFKREPSIKIWGYDRTVMGNIIQVLGSLFALIFVAGLSWAVFFLFLIAVRPMLYFLFKPKTEEEEKIGKIHTLSGFGLDFLG